MKLQSMTWSMRNDAPDDEIAERDSGHHFELSANEVIEDEPPCPPRRKGAAEPDTVRLTATLWLD
ncbi:MAG: hypothetical protein INH37_14115 [Myxococcaceae bacterium]|nr:hypothetical protein [Myxococcaceae bacterium]